MNKEEAIQKIGKIQAGEGLDLENHEILKLRAAVARTYWSNSLFLYGQEYGYVISLMDVFNITIEDLSHYAIKGI